MKKIVVTIFGAVLLAACGPKSMPPTNLAPQFSPAPPASAYPQQGGDTFEIPISVTDPDGDLVTVTATGLPPGIVLEPTWQVSTVAGVGPIGHTKGGYVDGPGLSSAEFRHPGDIAIDSSGNLFVTDIDNHRIRKITPNGDVSTFAGGSPGYADGAGSVARFNQPNGIAIDSAGNLFVADDGNARIRQIDPSGNVTTVAGMAFNAAGVDGKGIAAGFGRPTGIAVHPSGDLYVTDCFSSSAIRRIDAGRNVTTVSKSNPGFQDGPLGVARFLCPYAVAVDNAGAVVIADSENHRIRKFSSNGIVKSIAGSGDPIHVSVPRGVEIDSKGIIFFSEAGADRIRRLVDGLQPTIIAGVIYNGYLDGPGEIARFNGPQGLAIDSRGVIYVADTSNNKIRKLSPVGYRLAGEYGQFPGFSYEGDPCGGEFDVVLEADDGKGGKAKTTVTLLVPASKDCAAVDQIDLAIVKKEVAKGKPGGGSSGFSIAVKNAGPAAVDASNAVVVTDTFSTIFQDNTGSDFTVQGGADWDCVSNLQGKWFACTYNGPPVATGGAMPPIMVAVKVKSWGDFENCATVGLVHAFDPKAENNKSCVSGKVSKEYDAAITKTFAEPSVLGGPTVFTFLISNAGELPLPGSMYVEDSLPANFASPKNVSDPATKWKCMFAGLDATCYIAGSAGAPPGASYPPLVIEAVQTVPGEYENCATVEVQGDANPANNTSCIRKYIPVDIVLAKTGGGPIIKGAAASFELRVVNKSLAAIGQGDSLVVTDTLPAGLGAPITAGGAGWNCSVSGQIVSCAYAGGAIGAGASLPPIKVEAQALAAGPYENCATASLQNVAEADLSNNTGCASGEITEPAPPPSATGLLEISKIVIDKTGGTALPTGYKFPIYLACSNNPGIWVPVPLGANVSTTSPPSPAGIFCSAGENWGGAAPRVSTAKCASGAATWTTSYSPDGGGVATAQIPAGGTARLVVTNTLTCDAAPPPPSGAQLVVEKVVEESATGMSWKKPFPTGPNTAFAIEVTCPSLNGGKPTSLKLEHQKSQTMKAAVGETCTVSEPVQPQPSALSMCIWEPAQTSYLAVEANKTTKGSASVNLAAAQTYTVRVTNKAHCLGLF